MEHPGYWNDYPCDYLCQPVCEQPILACPEGCDDGNPCTVDGCDPAAGCFHLAAEDDSPCDDRDPCTSDDFCLEGVCTGTPVTGFCDNFNSAALDAFSWATWFTANDGGGVVQTGGLLRMHGITLHTSADGSWYNPSAAAISSFAAHDHWTVDVTGQTGHGGSDCGGWSIQATQGGGPEVCLAGDVSAGCSKCGGFEDGVGLYGFTRSGKTVTVSKDGAVHRTVDISSLGAQAFRIRFRIGGVGGNWDGHGDLYLNHARGY